jgi:hypothetical protein
MKFMTNLENLRKVYLNFACGTNFIKVREIFVLLIYVFSHRFRDKYIEKINYFEEKFK